jgi:hypothetical protein
MSPTSRALSGVACLAALSLLPAVLAQRATSGERESIFDRKVHIERQLVT